MRFAWVTSFPYGVAVREEKPLPVVYKNAKLEEGYRIDLLVEGKIIIELKAIDNIAPIHDACLLTYLRLSGCKIGLLINFNVPVLKDGVRRLVLNYEQQ
jgi:GxxExxY protein